jgi:hypothetical protein
VVLTSHGAGSLNSIGSDKLTLMAKEVSFFTLEKYFNKNKKAVLPIRSGTAKPFVLKVSELGARIMLAARDNGEKWSQN